MLEKMPVSRALLHGQEAHRFVQAVAELSKHGCGIFGYLVNIGICQDSLSKSRTDHAINSRIDKSLKKSCRYRRYSG